MRVLKIHNLPLEDVETVVTVGGFDGIHVAHKKLIGLMTDIARSRRLKSAVITFEVPPAIILKKKDGEEYLLTTLSEKLEILKNLGVDYVLLLEFTDEIRKLSAYDFLKEICVDGLRAHHIVLGFNHHFGHGKEGGPDYLVGKMEDFPLVVTILPPVIIDGILVSSTKIRELLLNGDVELAHRLLSREYSISGIVTKGRGLGRKMGFPTANLIPEKKLIPKDGVYLVKVGVGSNEYYGLANIGRRPTFGDDERAFEVHILDFDSDIIGETLSVAFVKRLRDERKFGSIEDLRNQIMKDLECARRILKEGVRYAGS